MSFTDLHETEYGGKVYLVRRMPGISDCANGRVIVVYPLLFGAAQLTIGPLQKPWIDASYMYADAPTAVEAALRWDGSGDPEDWIRCMSDGRRRPNGDPDLEFIRE